MVALAALPASVTVTNAGVQPLQLCNFLLQPGVATVLPLAGLLPGQKTLLWEAFGIALARTYITSSTSYEALSDPVRPPEQQAFTGGNEP